MQNMKVRSYEAQDRQAWDEYVQRQPGSAHCHLAGWKEVIERAYGHRGHYLIAARDGEIRGVLPLFHLRSLLWGRQLVSMPFHNCGGVLAECGEAAGLLTAEAIGLARSLGAPVVELRQKDPMPEQEGAAGLVPPPHHNKVRVVLELPEGPEALFGGFKSKLRSQIRRPQKEGMQSVIGGGELLDDFYGVFTENMRDLGSPVHGRPFFAEVLDRFAESARIGVVRYQERTVAAGLVLRLGQTVEIPWASSLKKYNHLSPNTLLYWSLLEDAAKSGYRFFDFGRSTVGEGTHRFKLQWGGVSLPLPWVLAGGAGRPGLATDQESTLRSRAVAAWQHLPLPVANFLGPLIRKHISL